MRATLALNAHALLSDVAFQVHELVDTPVVIGADKIPHANWRAAWQKVWCASATVASSSSPAASVAAIVQLSMWAAIEFSVIISLDLDMCVACCVPGMSCARRSVQACSPEPRSHGCLPERLVGRRDVHGVRSAREHQHRCAAAWAPLCVCVHTTGAAVQALP